MKVLHITPQAPGLNSGGALGVTQTLISLTGNAYEVDYVGPEIEEQQLKEKYKKTYELKEVTNFFQRAWNILHGITNSRYNAWMGLDIDFDSYDFIVMDFTKLDYVLKRVAGDRLYVRVHNVEADYAKCDYSNQKSFSKYIIKKFAGKQEKKIVRNACCLVTLTEYDKKRLLKLYDAPQRKEIIPVCVQNRLSLKKEQCHQHALRLLITGSLWFGENYKGIIWFIKYVCPYINVDYILTIAGANPTEEIKKIVKESKYIQLIDTPQTMDKYFNDTDLVIAPIFNGTGMKVKIAEAFSYGRLVVGTNHAFEGYKINNGKDVLIANNQEEFIQAINQYATFLEEEKAEMENSVKALFINYYDMRVSMELWKKILEYR